MAAVREPGDAVATPFEIHVPQDELDDLDERLGRTRFADDFGNDEWSFGVPRGYLEEVVEYWRDGFDWPRRKLR